MKLVNNDMYLLLIDEEAEIKENSYFVNTIQLEVYINNIKNYNTKKRYLKPILAYYPLIKEAKELDLLLLPNPFEESNKIEELACNIYNLSLDEFEYIKEDLSQNRALIEEHYRDIGREEISKKYFDVISFIAGYQAAQPKQYSEKDMKKALEMLSESYKKGYHRESDVDFQEADKFIQSLSTQQLPVSFEPEYNIFHTDHAPNGFGKTLKTTINSEGKEVLCGTYKY